MPVGQVPAVLQAHGQNLVSGLKHGEVDGGVRLTSGVGLYVGVFRPKQGLGSLDGEAFRNVRMLATTIIAFARITLRVLVGQDAGSLR